MKKKRLLQNLRDDGGLPIGLSKSFKVEKEKRVEGFDIQSAKLFCIFTFYVVHKFHMQLIYMVHIYSHSNMCTLYHARGSPV